MADQKKKKPTGLGFDDEEFDELDKAGKRSLFGRFNKGLNEAIQTGRGPDRHRNAVEETRDSPEADADGLAIRRARSVNSQKMIIPEGVIIEGSLTGGNDTEISGRIEGNISVDGRLYLGPSALVSGNIRAITCKIEGLVEGKVECSEKLDLAQTGRLNADVIVGKKIRLAGQVFGNVTTPGSLHLTATSKITGDVKTRNIEMEEGASLNGACVMRAPAQRSEKKK